jgi:hypothetical protein
MFGHRCFQHLADHDGNPDVKSRLAGPGLRQQAYSGLAITKIAREPLFSLSQTKNYTLRTPMMTASRSRTYGRNNLACHLPALPN